MKHPILHRTLQRQGDEFEAYRKIAPRKIAPRKVVLLSSHHGRCIQEPASLRCLLNALASRLEGAWLKVAAGSIGSELAAALAHHWRFGLEITHPTPPRSPNHAHHAHPLRIHPPSSDQFVWQDDSKSLDPEVDRWLIRTADWVVPCWIKKGGRMQRLIDFEINTSRSHARWFLPNCDRLLPADCLKRWTSRRASLVDLSQSGFRTTPGPKRAIKRPTPTQAVNLTDLPYGPEWVIHCTRPTNRRRPGESRAEFFHRWLGSPAEHWGPPIAALKSILRQRLIQPSRSPKASKAQTASLSKLPLGQFAGDRVYRRGRQQWDYLPYGIAFHPRVLPILKARPVQYQPTGQTSAGGGQSGGFRAAGSKPLSRQVPRPQLPDHWKHEQEWVRNGSIDLTTLAETDWIPFVPTPKYLSDLSTLDLSRALVLNPDNSVTPQERA